MSALWRRCPSPRTLAQLSLAEQSIRRWRDAYAHLTEALASSDDPWITPRRATLENALREIREQLPRIAPQTNVPGAEVLVDGASLGRLPFDEPRVLPHGSATIELRAAGYRPLQRVVSVAEGAVFREMLAMEPDAPPPTVAPSPRAAAPPVLLGGEDRRAPQSDATRSALGWSAVGVGAVLGAIGVWQGVVWSTQAAESANATVASEGSLGAWARYQSAVNPDARMTPQAVCDRASSDTTADAAGARDLCRENATHSALAWGLGLGGVAVTAVGVVLLITTPHTRRARGALSVEPLFGATVRGGALRVEF